MKEFKEGPSGDGVNAVSASLASHPSRAKKGADLSNAKVREDRARSMLERELRSGLFA